MVEQVPLLPPPLLGHVLHASAMVILPVNKRFSPGFNSIHYCGPFEKRRRKSFHGEKGAALKEIALCLISLP
jgi:hypothetical protein